MIDPRETRQILSRAVAMLATKSAALPTRKHGNPPQ